LQALLNLLSRLYFILGLFIFGQIMYNNVQSLKLKANHCYEIVQLKCMVFSCWRALIEYCFAKYCFLWFKNKLVGNFAWTPNKYAVCGISVLCWFDLHESQPEIIKWKILLPPVSFLSSCQTSLKCLGLFLLQAAAFTSFHLNVSFFNFQGS